jgi:hypothetical protein
MAEPSRYPHCGPETTSTYWMSKVSNIIETVANSPMVSFVSAFIASTTIEEKFPDGLDPETGEPIEPMERVNLILDAEKRAYDEYQSILGKWADSSDDLARAAKLAAMLADANYLSLSSIEDNDDDLIYARECAYEYARIIKQTVSMLTKTAEWSSREDVL